MAARSFTGPDGTPWQAWDVNPRQHPDWPTHARAHLPETLSDGWLCFEREGEKRRLHPIPAAWDAVSDGDLWELCLRAEPVRQRLRDVARPDASGG